MQLFVDSLSISRKYSTTEHHKKSGKFTLGNYYVSKQVPYHWQEEILP